MPHKRLVIDTNILIRAVLGTRVRELIKHYATPTLHWIFQILEGIHRVVTISMEGVKKVMIEGLMDLRIKILKLFGPSVCQLYQVDFP